ncbi:MAG: hypothetical protein OEW35_22180 [Gammaproteobacteria bacterium]|nr:hypothetical protein [Gammaproteobacteria bacterium]MDH4256481.1 hypothetical protein [Gammaproteobacteria bacterium]MDH5310612.1 hypothetical protein [Gammaproteobacteria bacterium]
MMHTLLAAWLMSAQVTPAENHGAHGDAPGLIGQARRLVEDHGDAVWPGISTAPFGILLIDSDTERLFCHPGTPGGFEAAGPDAATGCDYSERPAVFPPNLLASFPAVEGKPTVVIGTPAATGRDPDAWVLTIAHEHFHQMQFAMPGYYGGIDALELSGGDESGLWMLNYPFPYDRPETSKAFSALAAALVAALDSRGTDAFAASLASYWQAREAARETVSNADWRYVELQLWQEGVARWTEQAIGAYSETLASAAMQARERTRTELHGLDLARQGRVALYPIGAAEAMLLDAAGTAWRGIYWSEPFALGPLLRRLVTASSLTGAP